MESGVRGSATCVARCGVAGGLSLKRRVFFLLPHHRDSLPGGLYREGALGEAVDPRTIEVKKVGEKTPRSQSGPAAGSVSFPI